ncbi:Hsp70 family protein [Streptomyces sp. NPDC048337]|uniref:Hsp70 family protein n=1 Tax=Streptomyces sp. NPDC048337 TaxID=3365535 RepID=UPI003713A364
MTFGIDFGTSNSVVARSDGSSSEIVPVDGGNVPAQWRLPEFEDLFPSVLGVRELQRTLSFGWTAKTASDSPVDAVKRMLGTRSAGTGQADTDTPLLEEQHVWIGNKPFRSTAAAAALFAQMKTAAQRDFLDLSEAVITVPANATGGARYRTRAAARLAGITVKALLNEPTAAAISYANDIDIAGRLLIFDWGGGTIDVTLLDYDGKYFEELSSRGVAALGGLEFDEALARIVLKKLGQTPEKLSREERNWWRREVELTKISLSRRDMPEVPVDIPALGRSVTVSREEYTTAVAPLIERAMEPLAQCLQDTGISPANVDAVLMIGGTSQIPEARDAVASVFGADRILPPELCNPMTAVARGAAVYSAALDDPDHKDRFSLVTNYDLGTAFAAGPRKGFQPVIRRNRTLAAKGERRFTPSRPYASSVIVEIIEGEQGYPADSDRAFPLARLEVRLPRPEQDPERNAVLVRFLYDHSGILTVKVIHEATQRPLFSGEIDSFGKDGTPLQDGLHGELLRLLSHTEVPLIATGEQPAERDEDEEEEEPDPPASDPGLTVNGVPQMRV